jgi:hypothetical protein
MFIDELSPIVKELAQHPISFLGGFASGVLRLNLGDDPVRSWLSQQTGSTNSPNSNTENGKASGPQQINID